MRFHSLYRLTFTSVVFALCASLPASATPIDESHLGTRRGVGATQGSGIAHMVAETMQIRSISGSTPSESVTGNVPALTFDDIALNRIFTARREDSIALFSEANASTAQDHFPSAAALLAPGTSRITVAGAKKLQPWSLVPDQSERFLQVALGMMAVGFVPATLRRPR